MHDELNHEGSQDILAAHVHAASTGASHLLSAGLSRRKFITIGASVGAGLVLGISEGKSKDAPAQTDLMRPHVPMVVRGRDGLGETRLRCSVCHHPENFDVARSEATR